MNSRALGRGAAGLNILMVLWSQALAQDQKTALLSAERAAVVQSRDSGLAGALLRSMRGDGILLWPEAPIVTGTAELKRLLQVTSTDSLQLTWQPLGVELSGDSGLGITWGVAVANASRHAPSPEFGNYIAVWRRDGGRWSIAALVYAGLRLPKPVGGSIPASKPAVQARGIAAAAIAADLAFARLAADSGAAVAFERWAAPDAVTFGGGGLLTRGPRAIGRAVDFPAIWEWHPVAAGMARSGDLGWTVGEATIAPAKGEPTYSKYLTVWAKAEDGTVRFLTDGGNGRPPR